MTIRHYIKTLACAAAMTTTAAAWAGWTLDNERSQLSFVSIKAANIAEAHQFRRLEGTIGDTGKVVVTIDLTSVDTMIEIRDDRMQEFLFETDVFPQAKINTKIDSKALADLSVGEGSMTNISGELSLKDRTLDINAEVVALRLNEHTLIVSTTTPILLNTEAVGLGAGVEKLRELAGLPSISQAVPVTFIFTFSND